MNIQAGLTLSSTLPLVNEYQTKTKLTSCQNPSLRRRTLVKSLGCNLSRRKINSCRVKAAYETERDFDPRQGRRPSPSGPPMRIPPPPRGPPPPMRRAPPAPNARNLLLALVVGAALIAFQNSTKYAITPLRRTIINHEATAGMKFGANERVPGDVFMYNKEGQIYYQGEDGIVVNLDGEMYEEIYDSDGKLQAMRHFGNVKTIDFSQLENN